MLFLRRKEYCKSKKGSQVPILLDSMRVLREFFGGVEGAAHAVMRWVWRVRQRPGSPDAHRRASPSFSRKTSGTASARMVGLSQASGRKPVHGGMPRASAVDARYSLQLRRSICAAPLRTAQPRFHPRILECGRLSGCSSSGSTRVGQCSFGSRLGCLFLRQS